MTTAARLAAAGAGVRTTTATARTSAAIAPLHAVTRPMPIRSCTTKRSVWYRQITRTRNTNRQQASEVPSPVPYLEEITCHADSIGIRFTIAMFRGMGHRQRPRRFAGTLGDTRYHVPVHALTKKIYYITMHNIFLLIICAKYGSGLRTPMSEPASPPRCRSCLPPGNYYRWRPGAGRRPPSSRPRPTARTSATVSQLSPVATPQEVPLGAVTMIVHEPVSDTMTSSRPPSGRQTHRHGRLFVVRVKMLEKVGPIHAGRLLLRQGGQ